MTFFSHRKGPGGDAGGLDADKARQGAEIAMQASTRTNPLVLPPAVGNDARHSFATAFVGRARGLGALCWRWWACWRKKRQESPSSQNAAMSAFDRLLADAIKEGLIVGSGRRLELLRNCFEHIWQPADQTSSGTTGLAFAVCDDWLIESLYAASTRVLQDVAKPQTFTRLLRRDVSDEALLASVTVFHELSALINHAYALFQLSRSRSTYTISLDLHICIVVFSLAGLRAHMGDWQRTKHRPVFTLAGPIQRELEEKTAALTNSLADLGTVRAKLDRQVEVIQQQRDEIRDVEARNVELTRHIDHLQQALAESTNDFLQGQVATLKAEIATLTTRLKEEQVTVRDLQQKFREVLPVCDARVREAEAVAAKQISHVQYLKGALRSAGVPFNENWGVGHQGRTS